MIVSFHSKKVLSQNQSIENIILPIAWN